MTAARLIDVAIIGGGPAGLQAALTLGRARRTVVIIDAGHPRNASSRALRGFLTRDGILPGELLRLGLQEALAYPTVQHVKGTVEDARKTGFKYPTGFELKLTSGERIQSRKALLATGVVDQIPDVPGLRTYLGLGVYHCPYCDGFEYSDGRLGVYGNGRRGYGLARFLLNWSADITLFTDGPAHLSATKVSELRRLGIKVYVEPIRRLFGDGALEGVAFRGDWRNPVALDALFFNMPSFGKSAIAHCLGLRVLKEGAIWTGKHGQTSVPGVYAAGNVLKDVMLSIVAAAQGCEAAFELTKELAAEDL